MVDPKRHINLLSEEDQLFLNECEEEFKNRFSENDEEFTAYCAQASQTPPVLEPWQNRNFQGGGGYHGGRGRFNDRGRFQHHNRNRDHRYHPGNSSQHGNRYNNYRGRDNNRNDRSNSNLDRSY